MFGNPLWLGIGWDWQFLKSCMLNLGVSEPFQGRHKLQMLFTIAVMIIHAQRLCTGGVRAVGSETDGSLSWITMGTKHTSCCVFHFTRFLHASIYDTSCESRKKLWWHAIRTFLSICVPCLSLPILHSLLSSFFPCLPLSLPSSFPPRLFPFLHPLPLSLCSELCVCELTHMCECGGGMRTHVCSSRLKLRAYHLSACVVQLGHT